MKTVYRVEKITASTFKTDIQSWKKYDVRKKGYIENGITVLNTDLN